MSEGYTKDHLGVLTALGAEIPKRPTMSTKEIVKAKFSKTDNGDRIVRNAYRKLRDRGLIEIADRGNYRLTASGASVMKTIKEKGSGEFLTPPKAEKEKAPKKAAPKKAKAEAKKAAPKAAAKKPAAKPKAPQKAKPAVKKAAPKVEAKKAAPKAAPAKPKAPNGNGAPKRGLSAALPKKAEPKNDKPETKAPLPAPEPKATLPM